MNFRNLLLGATLASLSLPAAATLPTPPESAAISQAQAFLFYAGAGDIYEVSSSMMLLDKSRDPNLRAFASKLIDHHTRLTNGALAAAKAGGVMAPPPELTPKQKADLAALGSSAPAQMSHTYLMQQMAAHQQALAMLQGYARGGDTAALRQAAQSAIPIVQSHLAEVQALMNGMAH